MSASREKNVRQSDKGVITPKKQKALEEEKRRRHTRVTTWTVIVVIVLLTALTLFFSSNFSRRVLTAARVDGKRVTVDAYGYYYATYFSRLYSQMYSMYGQYVSYFMPPSLAYAKSMEHGEDGTWHDYLITCAADSYSTVQYYCGLARAEGFQLDEEYRKQLDDTVAMVKDMAAQSGVSVTRYLEQSFGKGITLKVYTRELENMLLADNYRDHIRESFTYSDADLAAYYAENASRLDEYSFRVIFLNAADQPGYSEEDPDAGMESLRAAWETIRPGITDSESYYAALLPYLGENEQLAYAEGDGALTTAQGRAVSESYAEWVRDDSRKEGDVTFVETDDGAFVLQFVSREKNDYATRDFYAALFPVNISAADFNSQEEYDAAKEVYVNYGISAFSAYYDRLSGGPASEEDFENAVSEYIAETGNTAEHYEAAGKNDYGELSDWLYAPDRQVGDVTVIYCAELGGVVLVRYTGENASHQLKLAEEEKRSEDFEAWEDAQEAIRQQGHTVEYTVWKRLIGA